MTTTITTYAPFLPLGKQLASGPGTLTGAAVPVPAGYQAPIAGPSKPETAYTMDATFYDAATPVDLTTPLLSVKGMSSAGTLALAFTKGLLIVQRSASSITVTTA
jgi:hypothetical protein